jgi:hypothetical protein
MEPSGKKLINTFSPHDNALMLAEAMIISPLSSLIDHDSALRTERTATRKSAALPAPTE